MQKNSIITKKGAICAIAISLSLGVCAFNAVAQELSTPYADINGDTIPDKWETEFAKKETLEDVLPLDSAFDMPRENQLLLASAKPRSVAVCDNFIFVLESGKNCLSSYDISDLSKPISTIGKTGKATFGSGEGEFRNPSSIAISKENSEIVVADTGNNRLQVFSFDGNGNLTFKSVIGTASEVLGAEAEVGTFSGPMDVAILPTSEYLVADTGNGRVQKVSQDGTAVAYDLTQHGYVPFDAIAVEYGEVDGVEGYWVANGITDSVYFFPFESDGAPAQLVTISEMDDSKLINPTDIKTWKYLGRERLVIVDKDGSRLAFFNTDGSFIDTVADNANKSLQTYEQLWRPAGCYVTDDSTRMFVADEGKNRVIWFDVTCLDGDGDGMNDFWEDSVGLDPTSADSFADSDGDGLADIGEYRANTNPFAGDSDGDGVGDLAEMLLDRDPNTADPVDPELSLTTFEDISFSTDEVVAGESVFTVTVSFAEEVCEDTVVELWCDGERVATSPLVLDESGLFGEATFVTDESMIGTLNARAVSYATDPAAMVSDDTIEVIDPADVCEPVQCRIDDILLTEPFVSLLWELPPEGTTPMPEFAIVYSTSLDKDAVWEAVAPFYVFSLYGEAAAMIYMDDLGNPEQCFFKIYWLNKRRGEGNE